MFYKVLKIKLSLRAKPTPSFAKQNWGWAKRSNPVVYPPRDCFGALRLRSGLLAMTFFLFILPFRVQAIGISVSPAKLEMEVFANEEKEAELQIKNVSSNVALFEVYLDDFESFVKARPSSFVLESQEEKRIKIKINPQEAGRYLTKISVLARPLDKKELQIGSGVKIPLEIEVGESKKTKFSDFILGKIGIIDLPVYFYFIVLVLLVYIFYLRRKIKQLKRKSD